MIQKNIIFKDIDQVFLVFFTGFSYPVILQLFNELIDRNPQIICRKFSSFG